MSSGSSPELGYWAIRGLAQPIRLLFAYAKKDFQDVKYEIKKTGDGQFDASAWFDKKFTLGLDLPNLPYIIDDDVKITESQAVMRHVARKYAPDTLGKDLRTQAGVDMLIDHIFGYRNKIVEICYGPADKWNAALEKFKTETMPNYFKQYEEMITKNGGTYLLGGKSPLLPDFHLYELADQTKMMLGDEVVTKPYPSIQKLCEAFESIPEIEKYMKSEKFMKRPVNNVQANFQ